MQATERIQLRTTPHTKNILEQASQILGVSVSYFILDSAHRRAVETVKNNTQITLNAEEWQQAVEMLDTPGQTHEAMQALFDKGYTCVDH
ncbi:DUF1778 domain-containing protein [Neisseria lisongii]|uniref:DUF1778 domain-containing protein n=1 Tax=Neisseria lisongii TaxID=2912188 RepID=A0AAW5AK35_9NEIS|nr:DUF1778 domain-containing protein [Neisseria lisongii]MCF7530218.1 DUF1778 domain-containing protein [Neisseria lisongii]